METKIKYKIMPAAPITENRYNVRRLVSIDGGRTFWYAGIGRFCRTLEEANSWIREELKHD